MRADVMESVEKYVDEVWEDVVSDIASLVAYPSVADASAAEPGAPFGRPVRDALDCSLGIAERLGYEVTDDDGYVGIADIPGECEEQIATIAHVDVVPAGPGWNTDPFSMERREGWLLGRGVIDDKGPPFCRSMPARSSCVRASLRATRSVRCSAATRRWA